MKKKILKLALTFLIITTTSCKKDPKIEETLYFSKAINKVDIPSNYEWLVILPGVGCHGCIQEGESFIQEHIDQKDILFVLTKIESLKILQNKIGLNIKDHSNIMIDREDMFNVRTDNRIYPCIIELENGKLMGYEFQSPENSTAFEKLQHQILIQ